jgi:hypothetical protein
MLYSILKELYDTERKLDERNFAKDHGFEEWLAFRNESVLFHNPNIQNNQPDEGGRTMYNERGE